MDSYLKANSMSKTTNPDYPEELTMEDGSVIRHRPLVAIKCIYCGNTATITKFESGDMGVLHVEPRCSEFVAMDPITYIQENRKKLQQDAADGKYKPN